MKKTIFSLMSVATLTLAMTACGPKGPSPEEVEKKRQDSLATAQKAADSTAAAQKAAAEKMAADTAKKAATTTLVPVPAKGAKATDKAGVKPATKKIVPKKAVTTTVKPSQPAAPAAPAKVTTPANPKDGKMTGGTSSSTNTSTKDPSLATPILTKPVSINNRETKSLQYTAFDAQVKGTSVIYLEMAAYDEDVARDWSQYQTWVGIAGSAVSGIVGIVGTPIAGVVVGAVIGALNQAIGWDEDDRLGIHSHTLTVKDLKPGENIYQWRMVETGIGWSTWDYTVRYKITVK